MLTSSSPLSSSVTDSFSNSSKAFSFASSSQATSLHVFLIFQHLHSHAMEGEWAGRFAHHSLVSDFSLCIMDEFPSYTSTLCMLLGFC